MPAPDGEAAHGDGAAVSCDRRFGIDMRRFEPHERFPLLEMSLATLAPGEALEVTFEQWPEALVRYLDRTCAPDLEWCALGAGAEWSSLAIRRRAWSHEA